MQTLETIREYASEQLPTEDGVRLAQEHARYFLELAELSEPALWAQHTDVWLPRLDPEEANFRAALGWSMGEDAEWAVRLSGALYPYWEIRARQREARIWLERSLGLGDAVALELRAKALIAAGRVAGWDSDWPAASALLEEAVDLCRRLGDTAGVGRCLGFIGHIRLFQGDVDGAANALNEGVELARRTNDRQGLARALSNAAWSAIEERDFDRARQMWEEGAAISRTAGMKPGEALCVAHIGYAEALAGDFDRALRRLEESLVLFEELGETTWTPVAQRYVGLVALLGGNVDLAEEELRASLLRGREHAPQFHLVYWLDELAAVASAKGDARRAATLWAATDAQYERLGMAVIEEGRQVRERYRRESDDLPNDQKADARARGRSMTLQSAVSFALTTDPSEARPTARAEPLPVSFGHLTLHLSRYRHKISGMEGVSQPEGEVTLVFSDIEGSTRLLHELGPAAYKEAPPSTAGSCARPAPVNEATRSTTRETPSSTPSPRPPRPSRR
ncbi:MAG: hypothetical protein H0T97_05205 [Actinobacteria bacterium]|nr:hypothetical protein [Actinomycetota bacterium]